MENKLAIIIPAYKSDYLRQTLDSVSNQTVKAFTVYIGDDASPHSIQEIVKEYENKMGIIYKRFETNLGGQDLVAQWERCIDMSSEEWIWLFSDDDIMEPNCVEMFYKHIEHNTGHDFLHFNVEVINGSGISFQECPSFPKDMTSGDFFKQRIHRKLYSFVVEYIFKRQLYEKEGKFEKFDLAWCSDDATWMKFAGTKGIHTIDSSKVKWRYSTSNISSLHADRDIVLRKLSSNIAYLKWAEKILQKQPDYTKVSVYRKIIWGIAPIKESDSFSVEEKMKWAGVLCKELSVKWFYKNLLFVYIYATVIKKKLKNS